MIFLLSNIKKHTFPIILIRINNINKCLVVKNIKGLAFTLL